MMKDYIDQLARSLLQKESLNDCSLEELKVLANDHPYFGAAQLLLAKKLKEENSVDYARQVEKTSLFFNNPMWLDQLLNDKGTSEMRPLINETGELAEIKKNSEPLVNTEEKFEPVEQSDSTGAKYQTSNAEAAVSVESNQFPAAKTKSSPSHSDFLFEPYHTVDYFASQGIRFKEEEKPADKFGQQLKSFTEWLKTLKRLPVSEIARQTTPAADQKVEQMAEASLAEKEVVTEAMAEVWIKQGNHDKAISIYEKLSLLEPPKSAYFAGKIEELKR